MTEQLSFQDLWFEEADFRTFIMRLEAYRTEIARLNEEIGALREEYQGLLPVKHLEQAYSIEAKRRKLAVHKTAPCSYEEQSRLEALVRDHLEGTAAETERALEDVRAGREEAEMRKGVL